MPITGQKLVDSTKRALLKYVYISDGTNSGNNTLLDVKTLAYSLNARGVIMTSNTDPKTTYRTYIKRIFGQAKSNGYITLQWAGDTNSRIVSISTGPFDYNFESMGDGAVIPNPEANSNGNILITTVNTVAADVATIFIDLKKDARDYDAGQTADPKAFNQ